LETQIIIAKELYFNVSFNEADKILEEVQKMLAVLIQKLSIY